MFVHTGENLPQDPEYAADLDKLGYKVDENKQIISTEHAHHFIYFNTSSDRANEKRKEAMHTCVRGLVKEELAELGVVEVLLGGEKGKEILSVGPKEKPKLEHLPILTTEPTELKKKRNAIVVIGEPSEDVGIWAWRHLLTGGGIERGSAVGLVKKLAFFGVDRTEVDTKKEAETEEMGPGTQASLPPTKSCPELDATAAAHRGLATEEPTEVPGIIILNPGALLWSNAEKRTMTMFTWLARGRLHALGEDYSINKTHNYIEGHSSASEHIETCLDHILPQLLADDANLYVVGITTSAEYFIDWYQSRQSTLGTPNATYPDAPGKPHMIKAMAFMEPTYNASSIKCEAVKNVIKECGRQWVKSDQALGESLNSVEAMGTPTLPSIPTAAKRGDLHLPDYDATFEEAANTTLASPAGNEKAARTDLAEQAWKTDLREAIAGDAPVVASHDSSAVVAPAENGHAATTESAASSHHTKLFPGLDSTISNGATVVPAEDIGLHSGSTQVPALENAPEGVDISSQEPKIDSDDSMTFSYDHTKEIVSCDTYSGKTDVDEMIWPNVIDEVLKFFKGRMAELE